MFDDLLEAFGKGNGTGKDARSSRGSSGGLLGTIGRLLESDGDEERRRDDRYRGGGRDIERDDDRRRGFDFRDLGEFDHDSARRRDVDHGDGSGRFARRRGFDFDLGD